MDSIAPTAAMVSAATLESALGSDGEEPAGEGSVEGGSTGEGLGSGDVVDSLGSPPEVFEEIRRTLPPLVRINLTLAAGREAGGPCIEDRFFLLLLFLGDAIVLF